MIANIMANPLALVDTGLDFICKPNRFLKVQDCGTDKGTSLICSSTSWGLYACLIYDTATLANDIYQDIQGYMGDGYWDFEFGPEREQCKVFADAYDRMTKPANAGKDDEDDDKFLGIF